MVRATRLVTGKFVTYQLGGTLATETPVPGLTVQLTPSSGKVTDLTVPQTAFLPVYSGVTDSAGVLLSPTGTVGIRVPVTNPENFTYDVEIIPPDGSEILPYRFRVLIPAGAGSFDITEAIPTPGDPGQDFSDWLSILVPIENIRGQVLTIAQEAEASRVAAQNAASIAATLSSRTPLNGARWVPQGDSLTQSFDNPTRPLYRSSYAMLTTAVSGGDMRLASNAGIGGYTSNQLRARFDEDVLAKNPTLVTLMPGRNDGQSDGTPADMIAYVKEAREKCRVRGIGFVLINGTPQGQAALATPSNVSVELASSISGSLTNGRVYRFKVTAGIGPVGVSEPEGETLASSVVASAAVPTGTSSLRITWDPVPGANWYGIYQETTGGSGVYQLRSYVSPSSSPGFGSFTRSVISSNVALTSAEPTSNTTARDFSMAAHVARRNAWLASYCAREGIPLVDVYSKLVDSSSGRWLTGLTYDGTHPNATANKIIADTIYASLKPLLMPQPPILVASGNDTMNMVVDGLYASSSAVTGGQVPTGFSLSNTPAYDNLHTIHEVAPRSGFKGRAYSISGTRPVLVTLDTVPITTGFDVGDEIMFSYRVETNLATSNGILSVGVLNQTRSVLTEQKYVDVTIPATTYTTTFTVRPGDTSLAPGISQYSGKDRCSIGQVTLYNLTRNAWIMS